MVQTFWEMWSWMKSVLCRFCNISTRFELFVPELSGKLQLLSSNSLDSVKGTVQVLSCPCCRTLADLIAFSKLSIFCNLQWCTKIKASAWLFMDRYPHSIQVGSHQSGRMDIGDHTSPVLENPQLLRFEHFYLSSLVISRPQDPCNVVVECIFLWLH